MSDDIRPFKLAIPDADLVYLAKRLDRARLPEAEPVDDWSQGTKLSALTELLAYWRLEYDWRRCERRLNQTGQYVTEIDGLDIHFLHVRSPHEDALPLVLTHGWPGSVVEFLEVIPRLTDPEMHGGKGDQAFHVVAPSLPGFGFSGKPTQTGWGIEKIAGAWATLMERLGYDRWVAQGGDWGSAVTAEIGRQAPKGCAGIHVNMVPVRIDPAELDMSDPGVQRALAGAQFYQEWDSGYSKQQSTRPQTIGYSLVDSPVGLAAWILEKIWAWSDNDGSPFDALSLDTVIDNIMLYWLPATGASAARLYWESFAKFGGDSVKVPGGASLFPKEIIAAPESWAKRLIPELVHWNELPKGGHFAAWEQPEVFANELRSCFAKMR
ncbi:epoxide hydrolase family protein [Erythrobacter sp. HKB08]|uniref:epoxide hydrolase family protein n=1 Tax=Erythrobacter sp. HKB08 TaxID=2502843 RepID=UPI00100905C5|nr:epoxide hydrolase family protein [Erythrobacter sp. HKB08]